MTGAGDAGEAQRERAIGAWELVVHDAATPAVLAAIRRALRVKRFELDGVAARLPGAVRHGARIDLEDAEARLREAGVRCELRRRDVS
jgi:hypothetical protein